jgi:flagellar biosynthesis GTPase FlhF
MAPEDQQTFTYRGRSLEELVPRIRQELGDDAIIVSRRETTSGGVGGFFAKREIEVEVRPGENAPPPTPDVAAAFAAQLAEAHERQQRAGGSDPLDAQSPGVRPATSPEIDALPGSADVTVDDLFPSPPPQAHGLAALFNAGLPPTEPEARPEAEVVDDDAWDDDWDDDEDDDEPAAPAEAEQPTGMFDYLGTGAQTPPSPDPDPLAPTSAAPAPLPTPGLAGEPTEPPTAEAPPAFAPPEPPAVEPQPPIVEAFATEPEPPIDEAPPAPIPEPLAAAPEPSLPDAEPPSVAEPIAAEPSLPDAETPPVPEAAIADEVSLSVPFGEPGEEAVAVPAAAPVTGLPPAALAAAERLVARGLRAGLADAIAEEAMAGLAPLLPGADPKELVTDALARRIPTHPLRRGPGVVGFVGPGGAGKTRCVARLAAAHARHGLLPVSVVALRSPDGGAELRRLLAPYGVTLHAVESGAEGAARIASLRGEGLVIVDTPGVSPRSTGELRSLGNELDALAPDELHLAVPATIGPAAAQELVGGVRELGVGALVLTHTDETEMLGTVIGLAIDSGLPLSYLARGQAVEAGLRPASATELASDLVP